MMDPRQRWGTPQSTQVQTLQELQKPLTDGMNAWQAPEGQSDGLRNSFNQMLADRFSTYQNLDYGNLEKLGDNYWNAAVSAARNGAGEGSQADQFFSGNGFDFNSLSQAEGAGAFDWAAYNKGMKDIADPFNEAQTRQQQAYGQMQGGNYFGGMINENYTNPNANQITGQTTGGLGGLGGFGGLAQSTPAGLAAQGQATTFGAMPAAQPQGNPNQLKAGGLGGLGGFGGPFRGS